MAILLLGINHKTAAVDLREKVAFSDENRLSALESLKAIGLCDCAVIISTCNRTELYLHNSKVIPQNDEQVILWREELERWLAQWHQLNEIELKASLYFHLDRDAVVHLMRVACGLDSLVLGEPQILGQVKQAFQASDNFYQQATSKSGMSSELSRLFQKSFSVAKQVRSETDIGNSAVSVAYTACGLARQIYESLKPLTILLVGAGETIELISRHLLQHGADKIIVANRTLSRAVTLVENVGLHQAISLDELQYALNRADIVMTSTGSEHPLIYHSMVKQALKVRHNKPMLIIDIAVPRDVESSVGDLNGVYHYSVDDLELIIQSNMAQRQEASKEAEKIIQLQSSEFYQWLKLHQSSGLIRNYRQQAEIIKKDQLDKALQALANGQDSEKVLQELSRRLTNQLLHVPTNVIQELVKLGDSEALNVFSSFIAKDNLEEKK